MGSNLSFIFSLLFVVQVVLFGGDLLQMQAINTELASLATQICYKIQKEGYISPKLYEDTAKEHAAIYQCIKNCGPTFGDTLTFKISKEYSGASFGNKKIMLSVTRSVIVGYFN